MRARTIRQWRAPRLTCSTACRRGGAERFDELARTISQATRLEADFWEMGLTLAD
jgi:thiaminase